MNIDLATTVATRYLHINPNHAPDVGNDQPHWSEQAVCASVDPELMFPPTGGSPVAAKRVCAACPVAADCLSGAITVPAEHDHGVRGGTTATERRRLRAAGWRPGDPLPAIRGLQGECPDCGRFFTKLDYHRAMAHRKRPAA